MAATRYSGEAKINVLPRKQPGQYFCTVEGSGKRWTGVLAGPTATSDEEYDLLAQAALIAAQGVFPQVGDPDFAVRRRR